MKAQSGSRGIYSSVSLTSALDGGWWLTPRPGRFTPGKGTGYPLYRGLDEPQGRSGLDGCGKSRHHRDSISGQSSPKLVAILDFKCGSRKIFLENW